MAVGFWSGGVPSTCCRTRNRDLKIVTLNAEEHHRAATPEPAKAYRAGLGPCASLANTHRTEKYTAQQKQKRGENRYTIDEIIPHADAHVANRTTYRTGRWLYTPIQGASPVQRWPQAYLATWLLMTPYSSSSNSVACSWRCTSAILLATAS